MKTTAHARAWSHTTRVTEDEDCTCESMALVVLTTAALCMCWRHESTHATSLAAERFRLVNGDGSRRLGGADCPPMTYLPPIDSYVRHCPHHLCITSHMHALHEWTSTLACYNRAHAITLHMLQGTEAPILENMPICL